MDRFLHLLIVSILLTADALALFVWLHPEGSWLIAAAIHSVVVLASMQYVKNILPKGHRGALALIVVSTFFICMVLPILGVFLMLGIALQIHRAAKLNLNHTRYVTLEQMTEIGEDDVYNYGTQVHSIVDIMHGIDISSRRRATLALRSIEPVFAIPLLKKLIQDSDETVRLYALNVLRTITNDFENRTRELLSLQQKGEADVSDLMELAEYYQEQVYVGLAIDDAQRHSLLKKAIHALESAYTMTPENFDILFNLIKYCLSDHDTDRAAAFIAELNAHPNYSGNLYPWHCELLFEEANWPGLRSQLRNFSQAHKSNQRLLAIRDFWLYGTPVNEDKPA